MTARSITRLHPRGDSLRRCQHCGRSAKVSVTLGNLGEHTPDRTTFYCGPHDPSAGIEAVLDYLRAGRPDVVAVIRAA